MFLWLLLVGSVDPKSAEKKNGELDDPAFSIFFLAVIQPVRSDAFLDFEFIKISY
jgi:hypothetical protein